MPERVPVKIINDKGSSLIATSWIIQKDGSVTKMFKTYSSGVLFSDDLTTAYIYTDPKVWEQNTIHNGERFIRALAFHTSNENLTFMVLQHSNLQYYVFVAHRTEQMLSKENDGTYIAPCALAGHKFNRFGYKLLESSYYLFISADGEHILNKIGSLNKIDRDFNKNYLLDLCYDLCDVSLFCTLDGSGTKYVFMRENNSSNGLLLPLEECLYNDEQSFNYQKLSYLWENRQIKIEYND